MLFRKQTLDGIERGEITLAFRRWKKATVKAGGSVRTALGVVRVGQVDIISLDQLGKSDAVASGFANLSALQRMLGPDDGNPVYRIELLGLRADERASLRASSELTDSEWEALQKRFDRWEKAAPGYFPAILSAIARSPEVAAATLAGELDVEKLKFKQDVRKLKELGLTESLDMGYRLSPRGRIVLEKLSS